MGTTSVVPTGPTGVTGGAGTWPAISSGSITLDVDGGVDQIYFTTRVTSGTTTVPSSSSFWVNGVTLVYENTSGYYIEIVGVKTYTSGGVWVVTVTCSVTTDGDTGVVSLGRVDFFQVNYITMPGVVVA
jgi:hypothetical protein